MTNQKPDVFGPENFNNNPILKSYVTSLINYPYLTFCCKTPHRYVTGNTRKIPNLYIPKIFHSYIYCHF